jgi:hypothetical protein
MHSEAAFVDGMLHAGAVAYVLNSCGQDPAIF